ncbi:MAG: O-antigen ligase family protein [Verrucomicrobia bacterium]|nr:O-antigen ligase family protein [Verrucomicrobiota bacterium]
MFIAAGAICGIGLIKSYSRGAWLGVAVAMGYFGWGWWTAKTHRTPALSPHLMGGAGEAPSRLIPSLRRDLVPLSVVLLSVVILAFWNFRHTEQATARRAFSVANMNDFSWRNRVAAWEGALQMMAGKPFLGFGWHQPERVYDQFYRVPKVTESAALQMNDYFTLGTTLGIQAMVCFLIYVGLSLTWNGERKDRPSPQPSPQRGEGENQAPVRRETDSLREAFGSRRREEAERAANPRRPPRHLGGYNAESNLGMSVTGWQRCPTTDWLRAACRAGAIVLLVGFWFDGGLFKLATGSVFWILLELGRSGRVEPLESQSVKAPDTL